MTTAFAPVMLKNPCGFCSSGHHELCPGAIWNPGSGEIVTPAAGGNPATYAGEAKWCPCQDSRHEGVSQARCRVCGETRNHDELSERLECLDGADCRLAAAAKTAANPLFQQLQECLTTRTVAGEVTERPRKLTPEKREKVRAEKKQAKVRPCRCGCEGVTKGGAFLPGHDARFVSILVGHYQDGSAPIESIRNDLAPFPALLAKFEKRVAQ